MKESAIVVFSGGQDSTTCLAWAMKEFSEVTCLSFDYSQRHRDAELLAAKKVAKIAGVKQITLPIDTLSALGGNALIEGGEEVKDEVEDKNGLPNTFVPGRNLLFLTFAAAYAYQKGITDLVTGVCQTDYSGYPDCREDTMQALEKSISLGMDANFKIYTPLMHMTKAETVLMMKDYNSLNLLAYSHTCYNGETPPCGKCPACKLRAKGFAEAGIVDPLIS